jgi:hypothetical protein
MILFLLYLKSWVLGRDKMKVILGLLTMFLFGFALFSSAFADHKTVNSRAYVHLET